MSRGRDFNTLPNRTFVPFVSVAQNVCCLSLLREMLRLSQLDRGRAIALILQGRSQRDVAQQFGVHESMISFSVLGWSGGVKVLCILHHRGVQLILAYIWARPAILVVGKGRGGMFLFLLFLHFLSCSSFFPVPLFHLLYSLFYLFSPFLWETTQNDPQGLTCR